eukprot:1358527-Rhodomonas_salina.4
MDSSRKSRSKISDVITVAHDVDQELGLRAVVNGLYVRRVGVDIDSEGGPGQLGCGEVGRSKDLHRRGPGTAASRVSAVGDIAAQDSVQLSSTMLPLAGRGGLKGHTASRSSVGSRWAEPELRSTSYSNAPLRA